MILVYFTSTQYKINSFESGPENMFLINFLEKKQMESIQSKIAIIFRDQWKNSMRSSQFY